MSLQVRDITSREDWFQKYQYEIPVLAVVDRDGREHEVRLHLCSVCSQPASRMIAVPDGAAHVWQVPRASPRVTADRLERHIVANLGVS